MSPDSLFRWNGRWWYLLGNTVKGALSGHLAVPGDCVATVRKRRVALRHGTGGRRRPQFLRGSAKLSVPHRPVRGRQDDAHAADVAVAPADAGNDPRVWPRRCGADQGLFDDAPTADRRCLSGFPSIGPSYDL